MIRISLFSLVALTSLVACGTTSEVRTPSSLPAAQMEFIEARTPGVVTTALPAQWWHLFDDTELDAHVERALTANADLHIAIANLETARAMVRQADAIRLPATVIESGAGPDQADKQPSTSSIPKTSYELGATVAYEIDLFGRLSSGVRAARADAAASAALVDAARIAVVGDTVAAYIDYCGAVQTRTLTKSLVRAHEHSFQLIDQQFQEGEVSPLEVAQAQTVLQRARANLAPLEADRRRALFRLATLEGFPPSATDGWHLSCHSIPKIEVPLPVGDGTALLARRPDVREAEQRVIAATARIDIAHADLYPKISLGSSLGLIAGRFDAILTPLITWSFPNRSAVRARIAAAKGQEAAALATWDAVILRALREVETALADYRAEQIRRAELMSALIESEKAVRRAQARFRLGADSYLLVLDAELTRTDIATLAATSDLRIAQTQIALFRALGGGWKQPSGQVK